jgi:hypothetical protein
MRPFAVISLLYFQCCNVSFGFIVQPHVAALSSLSVTRWMTSGDESSTQQLDKVSSVEQASQILQEWDEHYNSDVYDAGEDFDAETARLKLPEAVILLSEQASRERAKDSTLGRCMLGICAPSTEEAIQTLKAWVTNLQLPRGLLHGMDKDGIPIEIEGGVYIKYNTGGSATFADIRRSGVGFDALWKPGDALIEPYDGTYRGVYFQVELSDGEFRQYLVPLDTFTL